MDNTLKHHGVLGMKWGVRRYQNKDGTLTSAGKKHLKNKDIHDENNHHDNTSSKKSVKEMSDDEIRNKINRLELEKRYKNLSSEQEKKKISNGKRFVMDVLEKSGKNIATQVATYAMGATVNKIAKNIGIKNGTRVLKNKDGKPIIDDKGRERIEEIFEDIVNPRKGQKDK